MVFVVKGESEWRRGWEVTVNINYRVVCSLVDTWNFPPPSLNREPVLIRPKHASPEDSRKLRAPATSHKSPNSRQQPRPLPEDPNRPCRSDHGASSDGCRQCSDAFWSMPLKHKIRCFEQPFAEHGSTPTSSRTRLYAALLYLPHPKPTS